jgi:hypothetical protein
MQFFFLFLINSQETWCNCGKNVSYKTKLPAQYTNILHTLEISFQASLVTKLRPHPASVQNQCHADLLWY